MSTFGRDVPDGPQNAINGITISACRAKPRENPDSQVALIIIDGPRSGLRLGFEFTEREHVDDFIDHLQCVRDEIWPQTTAQKQLNQRP